jgi:two-component system, NarL family, response regulator DevR
MKVFIVEDAPQTRQELVELLAAVKGFEVVGQAGSVREALAGIEATAPQAVTLDISLPDGSGIEVLKHIRRRGWDLFVVVLTGNPYEALRAKCQQLGAVAVLDKINGLAQAAKALLAGRPCPETH